MKKSMVDYLNKLDKFIDTQFKRFDAEWIDFNRVQYYVTFVEKTVKYVDDEVLRYLMTNLEFDNNKETFLNKITSYVELNKDFVREYNQLFKKIVEDDRFTVHVIPLQIRNMNLIKQEIDEKI